MQSSPEASGVGRFLDGPRSGQLRAKMVGLSDSLLQRKRTQNLRLSAPALFLPSGVLRQPDLSPARRTGSSEPATAGCQPHHRPAQQDHHHLRPQGHQVLQGKASDRHRRYRSSYTQSFALIMETASSSSMSAITCACAPSRRPITSLTMGSKRPSKTSRNFETSSQPFATTILMFSKTSWRALLTEASC